MNTERSQKHQSGAMKRAIAVIDTMLTLRLLPPSLLVDYHSLINNPESNNQTKGETSARDPQVSSWVFRGRRTNNPPPAP